MIKRAKLKYNFKPEPKQVKDAFMLPLSTYPKPHDCHIRDSQKMTMIGCGLPYQAKIVARTLNATPLAIQALEAIIDSVEPGINSDVKIVNILKACDSARLATAALKALRGEK